MEMRGWFVLVIGMIGMCDFFWGFIALLLIFRKGEQKKTKKKF
jgi:hypothetical protein